MDNDRQVVIGVIGAMATEVALLREALCGGESVRIADMDFTAGELAGRRVVVAQSGMGKVNAGICAQILISRFGAGQIINTGAGGSLDAAVRIGDHVIATEAVQHDFDVSPIGYRPAEIPYTGLVAFPSDEGLREAARKAARACDPEAGLFEGRICSGDQFIASRAQKESIRQRFGGLCCEMEGAAIAQVCHLNHVPWVILRAISDCADDSEEISFAQFAESAGKSSARIVQTMLEAL